MSIRKSYQNEPKDGSTSDTSLLNNEDVAIFNQDLEENVVFFDIRANSTLCEPLIKLMNNRFAKVNLFLTDEHYIYSEVDHSFLVDRKHRNSSIRRLNLSNESNNFFNPGDINIVLRISPDSKKHNNRVEGCLTLREKEILVWLSKGLLYKEIAKNMGISIQTVKSHLKHIYPKLGVSNRTEAILVYLQNTQ